METTVTTDSRRAARDEFANRFDFPEFPAPGETIVFRSAVTDLDIAHGYERVVFTDYGVKVEFDRKHLCWNNLPVFRVKTSKYAAFDEAATARGDVLVFCQKNKAPNVGDVRPGWFYIDPAQLVAGKFDAGTPPAAASTPISFPGEASARCSELVVQLYEFVNPEGLAELNAGELKKLCNALHSSLQCIEYQRNMRSTK